MLYVLVNKQTGNYFKREIPNDSEGRCIDVTNIEEATTFDDYTKAACKCGFIGGTKYDYKVQELNQ